MTVTRDEFDALIRPILERTGGACRRSLRDVVALVKPRILLFALSDADLRRFTLGDQLEHNS